MSLPGAEYRHPEILELLALALREDIGEGDLTSALCVHPDQKATGRFYARQSMVIAGTELLAVLYEARGDVSSLLTLEKSGATCSEGQLVAEVQGRAQTLLECERTALNFLSRLSGVATLARRFAEAVSHTRCRVLDTRKTTPGWRRLEKLAAAAGGVTNHRLGLWDGVLIKNNHIAAAGGVRQALALALPSGASVEIEVRAPAEIEEALAAGARHLLLDNQTPEQARDCIRIIAGRATVELSGNITLNNIASYAETGADYVSSGAITHSAQSVDLNFRLEWN